MSNADFTHDEFGDEAKGIKEGEPVATLPEPAEEIPSDSAWGYDVDTTPQHLKTTTTPVSHEQKQELDWVNAPGRKPTYEELEAKLDWIETQKYIEQSELGEFQLAVAKAIMSDPLSTVGKNASGQPDVVETVKATIANMRKEIDTLTLEITNAKNANYNLKRNLGLDKDDRAFPRMADYSEPKAEPTETPSEG